MLEIVLSEKAYAVIGFRVDPELQPRIEELARKSTEGELTSGPNTRVMRGEQSRRHAHTTSAVAHSGCGDFELK